MKVKATYPSWLVQLQANHYIGEDTATMSFLLYMNSLLFLWVGCSGEVAFFIVKSVLDPSNYHSCIAPLKITHLNLSVAMQSGLFLDLLPGKRCLFPYVLSSAYVTGCSFLPDSLLH